MYQGAPDPVIQQRWECNGPVIFETLERKIIFDQERSDLRFINACLRSVNLQRFTSFLLNQILHKFMLRVSLVPKVHKL